MTICIILPLSRQLIKYHNILLFVSRVCPIFQVSNVTGDNLPLLKMFLNLLSSGGNYSESEPAEFQIDETYSVPVS